MHHIDSLDDPRVAAYRNLRDRTLRGESIFVTEGPLVARRLLASRFEAESVLVAERFAAEFEELAAGRAPLYVASPAVLHEIVGFHFHQGVLAAGRRPEPLSLDGLLSIVDGNGSGPGGAASEQTLLVCPEIAKPENIGSVFRAAGAFGIDGVLLGAASCDPFARRSLRVSMGGVFSVPWIKSATLAADLRRLQAERHFRLLAAVADPDAPSLADIRWPDRVAIVLGNEFTGLDGESLGLCDARATIPMTPGIDSLNLGVAAAIFAYQRKFGRR
jgi:tRNA G18 (ribose-2'-O)-methylase SpoU